MCGRVVYVKYENKVLPLFVHKGPILRVRQYVNTCACWPALNQILGNISKEHVPELGLLIILPICKLSLAFFGLERTTNPGSQFAHYCVCDIN